MEAAPPARRLGRRTFVVDPAFQVRYTLLLAGLGAFVSGLFGALMYVAHLEAYRGLDQAFAKLGAKVPPEVALQLSESDTTLVWLIIAAAVLMAIALGLFGMLITHRVAGPIYVMTRIVSGVAQGKYPPIRPLRKGDELQGFFNRLHEAIDALRARETSDAELIEQVVKKLGPGGAGAGASAELEALKALGERKRGASAP